MWALGNIAGDGPELRDVVLHNGIMPPLLEILASDVRQKKTASWTLSNLCRGKDPLPDPKIVSLLLKGSSHYTYILGQLEDTNKMYCLNSLGRFTVILSQSGGACSLSTQCTCILCL